MSLDNLPFTLALAVFICVLAYYMSNHNCKSKTATSYAQSIYAAPATTINNVVVAEKDNSDVVAVAERKQKPAASRSIRDRVIAANRFNPINYTQSSIDNTQIAFGF